MTQTEKTDLTFGRGTRTEKYPLLDFSPPKQPKNIISEDSVSSSKLIDINRFIGDGNEDSFSFLEEKKEQKIPKKMNSFLNSARLREGKIFAHINSELQIYDIRRLGCHIDVANEVLDYAVGRKMSSKNDEKY